MLCRRPTDGTWKLNEAKSKIAAGAPKFTTVVYEAAGDRVKVTVDGTDGEGKPVHNEWTGKYDGKDYPVTGDPNTDGYAVLQKSQRSNAGVRRQKKWQGYNERSWGRVSRRQDPQGHPQRNRFERQEVQHFGIRQTVEV